METIYLTGFSGVGKSMVGKLLSSRKNLKFLDTDKSIIEKENQSIVSIFESKGEEHFKNLEKYVLNNSVEQGMIVSLGTYIPKSEENRIKIKKSGRVIYLRAKASTICDNLEKEYIERPALKNSFSVFTVEKKMSEMEHYYEELANFVIDVDNKTLSAVFKEALAIYNYCNKVKFHIYIK